MPDPENMLELWCGFLLTLSSLDQQDGMVEQAGANGPRNQHQED